MVYIRDLQKYNIDYKLEINDGWQLRKYVFSHINQESSKIEWIVIQSMKCL